ncbi:type I DNA topoisomerase [Deinococcus radiophilus]|uniref:DNA topoisomerase 1 n=1 Tax=Deinococcus radiophilus TaxID=32062 RepID=A0A3S0KCU6_9DEIO|nr:type I DNA topoisomerase [Deinococcus radiophilus]RTR27744.1 type I DNA topoisomerase [Deinococcus radiophilus]UFA50063.1 type I DNA topoisomerase [Deinococcus radiophilus]
MPNTLVIVESPAKAKTIAKYLGKGYAVESSIGHIRDLPRSAADIPEKYKKESWARLGLNVDDGFKPLYVVSPEKRTHVARLRKLAAQADEIILATDDDREGESIAWHLYEELRPKVPVRRMVFHEITKEAIQKAIQSPREIDTNLVEAQETRRALDRLYGYEVSPVLWKKVAPKLSAGRVQSVATRMLVERERERMLFVSGTWWDLLVTALKDGQTFPARLTEVGGERLAVGKDFDPNTGKVKQGSDTRLLTEAEAQALAAGLRGQPLRVLSAEEKPFTQRPPAPFITSTLQQEGGRKLRLSSRDTMRAAQRLYEGGYITYMRTDSTNLSAEAVNAARQQAAQMYGQDHVSPQPRVYAKKAKNAQEAHEAIRPAGSTFRTPEQLRSELGGAEWRLYDLIWKRTVASQMADAKGLSLRVRLGGQVNGEALTLAASGRTIQFAGFLRAYVEGSDDPAAALGDRETHLPPLKEGDTATAQDVAAESHETQPPARFTEASLVQGLEAAGIGRPSTYASIIQTIQDRGYAQRKGQALVPSWTAFATSALLEHHFGQLVDYDFTARMEEDLDEIAGGRESRVPYLERFYLGTGSAPREGEAPAFGLRPLIETKMGEIDARGIATIDVPRLRGSGIELRVGRYGPYMQRGDSKANLPEDLVPDELTLERAEELMAQPSGDNELGTDPESGQLVFARSGRYGPYVSLGGEEGKPLKSASLFPSDSLGSMTLERALELLSLPRLVGVSDGQEVWAMNGRYGPYIKRGSDSRSLTSHDQLFDVTLAQAEDIFKQPKYGGRGQAAEPLAVYQNEGHSDIQLKKGRYGPYLTDGERNATLRQGESAETLSAEQALDIMQERGKEPKSKAGRGKKAASAKPKASAKKAEAPAKAALSWDDLKPYLSVLDDTERQLVTATREQGRKVDAVAPELGLDLKRAKGMALQASKRLNQAARADGVGGSAAAPARKTAPSKTAAGGSSASRKASATAKKAPITWERLKPYLSVLSPEERALVTATREQGRRVEEVAPELGLDVKQARGMALQASKKLNQAARADGIV